MKKSIFLSLLFFVLGNVSLAQSWTEEQKSVITSFNLYENDHRGVVFTIGGENCDETSKSTIDAVKLFFEPIIRKDLMTICVTEMDSKYLDRPLGLREVIDIYIELDSSK